MIRYDRCEKMLKLLEELLAAEEDRTLGKPGCTIDELDRFLDGILIETEDCSY